MADETEKILEEEKRLFEEEGIYTSDLMEADYKRMSGPKFSMTADEWAAHSEKLGPLDARQRAACYEALNNALDDLRNFDYPESISDTVDYLGVDPRGKTCKEDMDFAYRMQVIETKCQFATSDHREVLSGIKRDLDPALEEPTPLKALHAQVREAGEEKRFYSRALRRISFEGTSGPMANLLENLDRTPFDKQNLMLETLEYTVGIRKEPLTPAHEALAGELLHLDQNKIQTLADDFAALTPVQPTNSIVVPFKNFDNTLTQRFLAHPSNYRIKTRTAPSDYKDPAVAQANATAYAKATVAPTMDAMYQWLEEGNPLSNSPIGLNRGNMIIVNGKSVAERMAETYHGIQGEKPEYKDWYRDNLKDMTNELVGMALTSNGDVAAFMPDSKGRIPAEPVTIQRSGYEPSPLKPVTMNGWQRAWSKVGFYKEKKIAFDNYNEEVQRRAEADVAMKDACVRAQVTNRAGLTDAEILARKDDDIFFGAPVPKRDLRGFRTSRQCHITGARAIMLGQGYSLDEVLDDKILLEEKRAAGAKYLELGEEITPESIQFMAKSYAAASDKVMAYMDPVHDTMDISEAAHHPDYAKHVAIGNFCIDLAQETEMTEMKRAMVNVGRSPSDHPLTDEQVAAIRDEKFGDPLNSYAGYYRFLSEGEQNAVRLYQGIGNGHQEFVEGVCNNMFRDVAHQVINAKQQAEPTKHLSQLIGGTISAGIGTNSRQIGAEMATTILTTREEQKQFAMDTMAGKMDGKWCGSDKDFVGMKTEGDSYNLIASAFDDVQKSGLIENYSAAEKTRGMAQRAREAAQAAPARKQIKLKDLEPQKKEAPKHQVKQQEAPQKTNQKGGRGM